MSPDTAPTTTATCDALVAELQSPSLYVRLDAANTLTALGVFVDWLLVYGSEATRADIQDNERLLNRRAYVEDESAGEYERLQREDWSRNYD